MNAPETGFEVDLSAVPKAVVRKGQWLTDLKYRLPVRYLAAWAALILLIVVCLVVAPATVRGPSIAVVTGLGGVLAIAAFGQTLIIMLGGLDLSVPVAVTLAAGIVVRYGPPNGSMGGALVLALACAIVFSLINGFLITVLRLNALIVTLGTLGLGTGGIAIWTGVSFSVTGAAPQELSAFARGSVLNLSTCLLVAIVVGIVLALVLSRTRAGRQVAAIGANRRAARTLGTRTVAIELGVFATSGLLYGIAGVLVAGFIGTPDTSIGTPYQLATVTAAAIAGVALNGGPGSLSSVVGASLFLVFLDQLIAIVGLPAGFGTVLQGLALVVAVAAITIYQLTSDRARRIGRRRR